jgi:ribose transport system permease protein
VQRLEQAFGTEAHAVGTVEAQVAGLQRCSDRRRFGAVRRAEEPVDGLVAALELLGRSGIAAVIPTAFILLLVAALLVTLMLRYTRLGHHIYAIGGNRDVARMSGVRTSVPVIAAHVLCSLLAGIAGLLLLSRTGVGLPTIGSQGRYDLLSIAAVVLGGTLLAGGKGSVVGTIGGVAIFAVIDNVMGVMQVNPFLKDFVRGLVIVLAVAVYARRSVVRRPPRFAGNRPSLPIPGSNTKEETA